MSDAAQPTGAEGEFMPESLDFSTLTSADALDLAVLLEEECRQRYFEFVDLMGEVHQDAAAARFFALMADSEERHGQRLWGRRERSYPDAPSRVNASMLSELATPAYDAPTDAMTAEACLRAALAAERLAETFFRDALGIVGDPETRALFLELAEEEVLHQKMLADRLAGLASAAVARKAGARETVATD